MTLAIIFAYFALVLGIGWWTSRGETAEGFLLGDRKLGVIETVATTVAYKTGAGLLLVGIALVVQFGISTIWYFVGQILGFILFYFFVPTLRRLADKNKFYTIADFFRFRHGNAVGTAVAGIALTTHIGYFMIQLLGGGKVLQIFTGWSYELSVGAIFTFIFAYILLGGYRAVARTDFVQYLAIFGILGVLAFYFFDPTNLPTESLDLFAAPAWMIGSFALIGVVLPFASMEFWQRIYSAKNTHTAQTSLIWSVAIFFAAGMLLMLLGLTIRASFPGIEPDTALIVGLQNLLPAELGGIAALLFFAAIMSSADTELFTASSILTQDFLRKKNRGGAMTVRKFRQIVTAIGIAGFVGVLIFRELVDAVFFFTAVGGPIGLLAFASQLVRKIHPRTLVIAAVIGEIAVVASAFVVEPTLLIPISLAGTLLGFTLAGIFNVLKR